MNKKTTKPSEVSTEKTVFRKTGELIGTIGFHLAETGDKIMSSVSKEFSIVKKAIKKNLSNKKAAAVKKSKKAIGKTTRKKKVSKKIGKAATKIVTHTAKKSGKTNKK